MLSKNDPPSEKKEAVVIKKYANRRLYNTETSTYVTLEDLAAMVRSDRDFVVYDAKTGEDLTHSVLTQIIVEQEGRSGGQTLLPIPFLRQLIRFYDDSIARMVPSYLQMSLEMLAKEQERFRAQLSNMMGQNPLARPRSMPCRSRPEELGHVREGHGYVDAFRGATALQAARAKREFQGEA
jgi:polyhydroxyalkanoate synthesis repressor PhaR